MLAPPSAEAEDPPEELEDELDDPADALADELPDELDNELDDESLVDEAEDDSVERMLEASSKLGGPLKENWTPVGNVPVCPFLSITPNAVSCRNHGKGCEKARYKYYQRRCWQHAIRAMHAKAKGCSRTCSP